MTSDKETSPHRDKLHQGVSRFHNDIFSKNRERYQRAASEPQKPHTLFITCADSRISPEALTQSGPGEIFVTRNIGNLVPAYGQTPGSVTAVVEYSVVHLNVSQIVVCGHSDCGAMKGLLNRESLTNLPMVDKWLQHADAALSVARARYPHTSSGEILTRLIEENVLLQMHHLRTHPSVAGRVAAGKLSVYGWVYEIGEGSVKEYQPERQEFASIL